MKLERYSRQLMLPQIGEQGQRKLASAKVLVVGVGGLGSASTTYLAAAGVGTLGIVDFDKVEASNLQRQVLYDEQSVGLPKVECAAKRLAALNSTVNIIVHGERFNENNAETIASQYDIVVDGCDSFETRCLISDACSKLEIPYVYGAISEFAGQVAVLCMKGGQTLRQIYGWEDGHSEKEIRGVIGITPGIVGLVQANQVLQLLCGYGQPLVNKLWVADFTTMQTSIYELA